MFMHVCPKANNQRIGRCTNDRLRLHILVKHTLSSYIRMPTVVLSSKSSIRMHYARMFLVFVLRSRPCIHTCYARLNLGFGKQISLPQVVLQFSSSDTC